MIPMADNFNHADVYVTNYLINTDIHCSLPLTSTYYSREKYMNNYESLFTKIPEASEEEKEKIDSCVKGFFDKDKYE